MPTKHLPTTEKNRILFGQRLRAYREASDLTQADMAIQIGMQKQHISRWELGKNLPGIDNLIRLSSVLSVPVDELIKGLLSEKAQFTSAEAEGVHLPIDFVRDLEVLVKDRIGRDLFHALLRRYKSNNGEWRRVLQSLLSLTDRESS